MTQLSSKAPQEATQATLGRVILPLLLYSVVFGFLGIMGWGLVNVNRGPPDSGLAPDFSLTSFDGETITLSELRGRVVVINFWASWCPPCREEAAYLEATWRTYRDQGVVFIGVDYVDTEKEALAYLEEYNVTYVNGPDLGTRISSQYRIQGVPETFYVGKDGEIKGHKKGPLFPPELDQQIEELLAEPQASE